MRILHLIVFILLIIPLPLPAQAQDSVDPSMLEISAAQKLEWFRAEQRFVATGDASARQGDTEIRAEILRAFYEQTPQNDMTLMELRAEGAVVIISPEGEVRGDTLVYDVQSGMAEMTGDGLRMETPGYVVTARDSLTYNTQAGILTANGRARTVQEGNSIEADRLQAEFTQADTEEAQQDGAAPDPQERSLKRLVAEGNVVITTPMERLTGTYGVYQAASETAEITGGVTITRGPNVLTGARATVNLRTSISRLFGQESQGGSGRVRGVFYTGEDAAAP